MTSRREFLDRAALVLGGFGAHSLPAWSQPAGRTGGTLRIGSQGMRTLNSAIQPGNFTGVPACQLFAGLFLLDNQFKPQPYLAKSWEISPDALLARFTLVEGATFHDKRPITARDVAFSINTVKAAHPLMSVAYGSVLDSAKAVSDSVVEVRLKAPFQGLMGALTPALTPILPEHVFGPQNGPIQTNPANAKPIGSGPFKLVEWKTAVSVIMERHEGFFRQGRPLLDRLVFQIVEDPTTRGMLIERGELDYLPFSFLRVGDLARLKANPQLSVLTTGYEALGPVSYLEMNLRVEPLNDLRVRQAIAHAINKDFIAKTLHKGFSRRLDGPLHSGNAYFDRGALAIYDYNLKKANELLDAAGHPRGKDNTRFTLTIDIPTFEPDGMSLVAEYIRSQMRHLGINITLRPSTDFADWANRIGQWNYQLTMNSTWNWSDPLIGVDRSFLSKNIHKQVWTNTEGYSNPRVDEALAKAAVETDPAARRKLYSEFQSIVTKDLPFIWTTEGIYVTVVNKRVRGIPSGVFGALAPFDEISLA